ncbi:hypothetical protein FNV43_RR20952 [Rhamnella rubrinervis]|uniref:Uncharacterized protein n=1 Tax=Rhamnella rubrinervis TaxID=2594499 RepID=A0A8K0GV12_9ROSA|nr:hypothetical protein FNV43_RR20952 [Rhamnella rubrinervis]
MAGEPKQSRTLRTSEHLTASAASALWLGNQSRFGPSRLAKSSHASDLPKGVIMLISEGGMACDPFVLEGACSSVESKSYLGSFLHLASRCPRRMVSILG